jgi:hypothetical protein
MHMDQPIDQVGQEQVEVFAEVTVGGPFRYVESHERDRRKHRRHDLECSSVLVERYEGATKGGRPLGEAMDLSASGIRIRVRKPEVKVGSQLRIRLRLPQYAGISPFVANDGSGKATNEWTGWMTVTRMSKVNSDLWDVAGRLVDMREIDRGMLTLYLSAHPLAA